MRSIRSRVRRLTTDGRRAPVPDLQGHDSIAKAGPDRSDPAPRLLGGRIAQAQDERDRLAVRSFTGSLSAVIAAGRSWASVGEQRAHFAPPARDHVFSVDHVLRTE